MAQENIMHRTHTDEWMEGASAAQFRATNNASKPLPNMYAFYFEARMK